MGTVALTLKLLARASWGGGCLVAVSQGGCWVAGVNIDEVRIGGPNGSRSEMGRFLIELDLFAYWQIPRLLGSDLSPLLALGGGPDLFILQKGGITQPLGLVPNSLASLDAKSRLNTQSYCQQLAKVCFCSGDAVPDRLLCFHWGHPLLTG